ncbi:hypothetical protein RTCIAT899_PB01090 (plasmid) [Rhizobium tropici CIAT 899]|nr:hypothetical protein RTCIAT899_PB01090 [Rhizobium tropici CIAT 899]
MALGSLLFGFATKYLSIREPLAIAINVFDSNQTMFLFNGS